MHHPLKCELSKKLQLPTQAWSHISADMICKELIVEVKDASDEYGSFWISEIVCRVLEVTRSFVKLHTTWHTLARPFDRGFKATKAL